LTGPDAERRPGATVGGASPAIVDEVFRREMLLLEPSVRSSPQRVLSLLHPEFVEFGSSGHRFDAAGAAAVMAASDRGAMQATRLHGFSAVLLAADVVLATYETHRAEGQTRRSSVWVLVDGEWRLRFHQATVAAP
jgi:hypothetical protein